MTRAAKETTAETAGYREAAKEPTLRIRVGPFAPSPGPLALVLLAGLGVAVLLPHAERSAEFECRREESGAAPDCVRRSRTYLSPDVVRSSPAVLERAGPSGNAPPLPASIDVIRWDGITLMLPNNPPGPLTHFLDDPDALSIRTDGDSDGGIFLVLLLVMAGAFFFPLTLVGAGWRWVVVDRRRGVVGMGQVEIPIDELARVRVEAFGDGALTRLRGVRIVLERVDGTLVPLAPYARPPSGMHVRTAWTLAKALGLGEPRFVAAPGLAASPPSRGLLLALQIALAATFAVVSISLTR